MQCGTVHFYYCDETGEIIWRTYRCREVRIGEVVYRYAGTV